MTIVEWPLYSEFKVDKSLSGEASSGVLHAGLRDFGSALEYGEKPVVVRPRGHSITPAPHADGRLLSGRSVSEPNDPRHPRSDGSDAHMEDPLQIAPA
jgi:hypothetical protein